jgi:LysR family nitrogen assimilation transcriptional regulator
MIERAVRKHGIRLNIVTEIDSVPQMLELVERASCYSLVPQKAVLPQLAAGTIALVPIVAPTIRQTTFIARKSSHPTTRAIAVVEEVIVTVLKDVIRRRKLDIDLM